jgi:hypothetical protein
MIGHTVRKSAPGAEPGITGKTLCCLDLSVFAAAVSPRKPKTQRGGSRRTLAEGASNIAPRKLIRGARGDLFPRLQFDLP